MPSNLAGAGGGNGDAAGRSQAQLRQKIEHHSEGVLLTASATHHWSSQRLRLT